MINFLHILGLNVDGEVHSTTMSPEQAAAIAMEHQNKLIWIIALLVILAGILYFTFAHSKVRENIKHRHEVRASHKNSSNRASELERLHEIKAKNKRK
jgi:flagellar biosynthesis protein FlhB